MPSEDVAMFLCSRRRVNSLRAGPGKGLREMTDTEWLRS